MKFLEIISNKKLTIIGIFLFFYVFFNLLDGERGLISYFDKQKIKKQLTQEKELLISKLDYVEKKNRLLTDVIDLDYIEILYRKKFTTGKIGEKIYNDNSK
tara:strand:+ start:211 stop:513 length:303 start_codon:yes stop_codon:yes gene_type:complete